MIHCLLLLLCVTVSSWGSNWKHHFELHQEIRSFNNDQSPFTRDNSYSIKLHNRSKWKHNRWSANFSKLLRRDPSDHRDSYLIQELWIRKDFDNFSITAGSQIHDWTALEAFHPADVINARNLDSDFERPEKIGEWMLNLEIPDEESVWNLYYMPHLQTQMFPKINSRLNPLRTSIVNIQIMDSSSNLIPEQKVEQFGIRYETSRDDLDYSFHYLNHYDRQNSVLFTQNNMNNTHVGLPKVEQIGGTLVSIFDDSSFKLEWAYRNYSNKIQHNLPSNKVLDHASIAAGLEFPRQLNHGAEIIYLVELQTLVGPSSQERAQMNIFQRDLLLGARFARNDIQGTQITGSMIFDLERSKEILSQLSFSRRINDMQKYQLGLRYIDAPPKVSLDTSGLKPFHNDFQITGSLIHYF
ncbi:MAG: hypothetical protein VX619_07000 [bacterium]|nr:hypothetical protein [bacterium]